MIFFGDAGLAGSSMKVFLLLFWHRSHHIVPFGGASAASSFFYWMSQVAFNGNCSEHTSILLLPEQFWQDLEDNQSTPFILVLSIFGPGPHTSPSQRVWRFRRSS
jgi:hypothetical protein